jgi:hypothetical protein
MTLPIVKTKKALLRFVQVSLCLGPFAVVMNAFELHPSSIRRSRPHLPRQQRPPFILSDDRARTAAAAAVGRRKMMSPEDSADRAEPLPLSVHDVKRLRQLQSRRMVIPILIVDSILPRQSLHFKSDDPKFRDMVEYCLRQAKDSGMSNNENYEDDDGSDDSDGADASMLQPSGLVGMIGLNPHTGRPVSRGVCVAVNPNTVSIDKRSILLRAMGRQRLEVQGQAWLHESGSFYMADVELVDGRVEAALTDEQRHEVKRLSKALPAKLREWVGWVLKAGATDRAGMEAYVNDLGPMPKNPTGRAFWVAALINPLPALGVCLEIRPAMLSCSNDLDRMILASQALQSSIDHLSGKNRLFT